MLIQTNILLGSSERGNTQELLKIEVLYHWQRDVKSGVFFRMPFQRCKLKERFIFKFKRHSRMICCCVVILFFCLLASTLKDDQKSRIEKNLIKVLMVSGKTPITLLNILHKELVFGILFLIFVVNLLSGYRMRAPILSLIVMLLL